MKYLFKDVELEIVELEKEFIYTSGGELDKVPAGGTTPTGSGDFDSDGD